MLLCLLQKLQLFSASRASYPYRPESDQLVHYPHDLSVVSPAAVVGDVILEEQGGDFFDDSEDQLSKYRYVPYWHSMSGTDIEHADNTFKNLPMSFKVGVTCDPSW